MIQDETISGTGPWRISFENGQVAMIEIWPDDASVMTFGKKVRTAPCAWCGDPVEAITVHNLEQALCERCTEQALN